MQRISAITIALVLMIGLTAEAQAALSGVLKCNFFDGQFGTTEAIYPVVVIYNTKAAGVQNLTRIRLHDSTGLLLVDIPIAPPSGARTWINPHLHRDHSYY
jgi:hypothetical protein